MSYNGWSNYETWCVALWIDNDEGSYEQARDLVREAVEDPEENQFMEFRDRIRNTAAKKIEDMIDALREECGISGLFADLLGSALSGVDWREIAGHYLDEFEDEIHQSEIDHGMIDESDEDEETGEAATDAE